MTKFPLGTANRRAVIARVTDEALALRGTVMLEVRGDPRRWCAVRASVQGDLELRIAEPRRGWHVWRRSPGERWLVSSEFTHGIDAWSRPVRFGVPANECATILDSALERALGVSPEAPLQRTLVHPGVPDGIAPPARDADYAHHLAAALTGLVRAGRGHAHVECGRPARPLAWAYVQDGGLIVETESPHEPGTERELADLVAML